MDAAIHIEKYQRKYAAPVRALFVTVNRLLAPPDMREAFEAYIARSLTEEIDRIEDYYGERGGGFWIAHRNDILLGCFGLEQSGSGRMELRRMYVDPGARRAGIARAMLNWAEEECRASGRRTLELSTSELQPAALELYRAGGYRLVREAVAEQVSNKTAGGGIRRYYFEKGL